ncbi:MAG: hypothetical protein WD425_02245 [Nitrospirales bacterium]
MKQACPAQHGQPIKCVRPEVVIVGKGFKRFQKEPGLDGRMLLSERCLQFLDKIAKPDRVLLIPGMAPMGWLVKRETWRLVIRYQLGYDVARE